MDSNQNPKINFPIKQPEVVVERLERLERLAELASKASIELAKEYYFDEMEQRRPKLHNTNMFLFESLFIYKFAMRMFRILKNPKDIQTKILEGTVSRAQLLILLKVYNNSAKPLPSNFELHQLAYNDDAWCKSKMSPWFDRYNTEHQI